MSGYLKDVVDLELYDLVAKSIPFLDVAMRKMSRMIVPFHVTCDNEKTEQALNDWLESVSVGYVNQGFMGFARRHVRQVLLYGKAAGEIALTDNRRAIAGLFNVDSKKLRLVPEYTNSQVSGLLLGEEDGFGKTKVYGNQELFIFSSFNGEGDDPHGVSILRSVPWLADIILRMENALRQKWQRHGAPSFLVQYKAPETSPQATLNAARDDIRNEWLKNMRNRWEEQGIIDMFAATPGVVDITALGDNQELQFVEPFRTLIEQIVSVTELAPFMLGLQWSTTERLSQQQADSIISTVKDYRNELEPDFLYIIDWAQRFNNLPGEVHLEWEDISLQDRVDSARAQLIEAQAIETKQRNAEWLWRNGGTDQLGALQEAGYEVDAVTMPLTEPAMASTPASPANVANIASQLAQGEPAEVWSSYP